MKEKKKKKKKRLDKEALCERLINTGHQVENDLQSNHYGILVDNYPFHTYIKWTQTCISFVTKLVLELKSN